MEPFIQAAAGIDVDEIMAAIQKRIQDKKDAGLLKQSEIDEIAEMELQPLPDFQEIPFVYEPMLYPGLAENMAPVQPSVPGPGGAESAGAAAPEETIDETGLAKGILKKIRRLLSPWIRFMTRPLYLELKTSINGLQQHLQQLQQAHSDLLLDLEKKMRVVQQSSEYIRLLHNTAHNLIIEATKLKTEEELLKTRLRIMEDKIEFLENRQRALEKKLPS
jgi:hypothetical protein